ncbi:MAG TPA: adenylosuccinate lyase, partial [Candidatus Mcinerneyibacterium sp.]|nr:adenylosuccinate lyase [Candidatus Mcinerneyibacterium sp.]
MDNIKNISVVDGRYAGYVKELKDIFSEYGLIKKRVFVEIKWLIYLSRELKLYELSEKEENRLFDIYNEFDKNSALKVKDIEKKTNHDVKAVEYYIKKSLEKINLNRLKEWVHFSCTSEDINNTSYALMMKEGKNILLGNMSKLLSKIEKIAKKYKNIPMMAKTHGQPASPTTVGKEFINFAYRLKEEKKELEKHLVEGKFNGATGNYNAHHFAFDNINWIEKNEKFIKNYLNIKPILFTTQINPYSYFSKFFHILIRFSSILIDFDRDMWGYISFDYFKQKLKEGEVGSSTMPHKVNPIDFENSEGNLGISISLMEHLSTKLLNSRFQRDLTDSTVLRNIGLVFSYQLIAMKKTLNGLDKIEINKSKIKED